MKTKILTVAAAAAVLAMFAVSCSSGNGGEDTHRPTAATTAAAAAISASTTSAASAASTTVSEAAEAAEPASLTLRFETSGSAGNITISGDSPVAEWLASQPGEVSLDLFDADADDDVSVVEAIVSFWFFRDDDSGDVPPLIYQGDDGRISDSLGTVYVVESQGLPPAPGTETTTTTTTTAVSSAPETAETPTSTTSTTTTTTTTATTSSIPTVTLPELEPPSSLLVQVLNGSGVAGAAGRMTAKLSQAGYVVRQPANAPGRYSSSAVYYAEGWEDDAEDVLAASEIDEVEETLPMPEMFNSEWATVIVLLGTDTAPAVAAEQASLRPRPDFSVKLPLGDDVPRDRYVPGLANIQIYTQQNDEDPVVFNYIHSLQRWLRYVANFRENDNYTVTPKNRGTYENLLSVYDSIEEVFDWLGFTPQNVCGAPPGYSFTELLQPTREFSDETQSHRGDAIFTTDRLIELHGGERINPESDLDFYVREAAQTAYDALRLSELLDETEAPQLILCRAFLAPSGEVPEFANGAWYALLTPGIQPRESLLSQGTYHLKEMSKNGNMAYVLVCHPTLGSRYVDLAWREAGCRAEVVGTLEIIGCQADFEDRGYIADYEPEETIKFSFGERVVSASDLLEFPRN